MVVNYAIRYIDQRHLVEAKKTYSFQNLEIPKNPKNRVWDHRQQYGTLDERGVPIAVMKSDTLMTIYKWKNNKVSNQQRYPTKLKYWDFYVLLPRLNISIFWYSAEGSSKSNVLCSDLVYFYAIGFMVGNSQSFFSLRLLPTGFDINVIIDLSVWFEIFYESFGKILLFSDGLVSGFYEPARPNW